MVVRPITVAVSRSSLWVVLGCSVVLLLLALITVDVRWSHRAERAASRAHERALALWESQAPTTYSST